MPAMDWQTKAMAFRVLERLPFKHHAYAFLQRRVTRTIPRNLTRMDEFNANLLAHWAAFERHGPGMGDRTLFEFGAGWDLCSNLVFHALGMDRQVVVDIQPLAALPHVNHVLAWYRDHPVRPGARPVAPLPDGNLVALLRSRFGIDYRSPVDAATVSLPDGSIDFVASTNTMEHVPADVLAAIMRNCHRFCHGGSVLSLKIDYGDHWSYVDRSINTYNYLRYDDAEWRRFNPPMHYQNRLRHSDFRRMFRDCGFRIVEDEPIQAENAAEMLAAIPLAPRFRAYDPADLAVEQGRFVLMKA